MDWPRRLCFLAGQIGMMCLARFLFMWNIKYANQPDPAALDPRTAAVLFDAALIGVAIFGFRVFDGVTDPLAGALSDGWVRRGRERRTLLLFALVPPAVGLGLIFLPTHAMSPGSRWASYLAGMFIFFVGYTLYAIPFWSLVEDYSQGDVGERRLLSTLLGAGLLLATAVASLVSGAAIQRLGYFQASLCFGAPALLLMVLPYYAKPRGLGAAQPGPARHADGAPGEAAAGEGPMLSLGELWRNGAAALRHKRFLAFLLLFCGSQMAFTVVTAAAAFITANLLHSAEPEKDVAKLMAPFLATALPTFVLAPALSRRFGWERVAAVASVLLAVVYAGTAALGRGIIGSPMTTAMVIFGCGGPFAALILGLEGEAITDCARERGGKDMSLYWGVFNLVVKALNGLATLITGVLAKLSLESGWEQAAVRGMSVTAGVLLLAGLAGYLVVRRRTEARRA
jgi:Na+/melibiose symporter-like transporter